MKRCLNTPVMMVMMMTMEDSLQYRPHNHWRGHDLCPALPSRCARTPGAVATAVTLQRMFMALEADICHL